jgi:hypothetical protein
MKTCQLHFPLNSITALHETALLQRVSRDSTMFHNIIAKLLLINMLRINIFLM